MVRPAETEGEVRFSALQHFLEGSLKQLLAIPEPIVIIAEPLDACFACQLSLLFPDFWQTQVVEAQVGRDAGLVMTSEEGARLHYVVPFREAWSPPFVVLWYWVVLRQI